MFSLIIGLNIFFKSSVCDLHSYLALKLFESEMLESSGIN